jgi:hypothetical protein
MWRKSLADIVKTWTVGISWTISCSPGTNLAGARLRFEIACVVLVSPSLVSSKSLRPPGPRVVGSRRHGLKRPSKSLPLSAPVTRDEWVRGPARPKLFALFSPLRGRRLLDLRQFQLLHQSPVHSARVGEAADLHDLAQLRGLLRAGRAPATTVRPIQPAAAQPRRRDQPHMGHATQPPIQPRIQPQGQTSHLN